MVKFVLVVEASLAIATSVLHTLATSASAHVYICLFHFKFEDAFVHGVQRERAREGERGKGCA